MKWFGESWGAPVCDGPQLNTPVGLPCARCHVEIIEGDRGVVIPHHEFGGAYAEERPWHLDCMMQEVGVR